MSLVAYKEYEKASIVYSIGILQNNSLTSRLEQILSLTKSWVYPPQMTD